MFGKVLAVLLAVSSLNVFGTEVEANGFNFILAGEWVVESKQGKPLTAIKNVTQEAFIVSTFNPNNIEEGSKLLSAMKHYLGNLEKQSPNLVKTGELTQYIAQNNAPWEYIVYKDIVGKNYFIGACLGSNAGILMITYEGPGDASVGVQQLKTILGSMTHNGI